MSDETTGRLSTLIAIVIGVVTLTGAYLTWRSVNLAGNASSADRQAVVDTIAQQKARAYAQAELRFEQGYFARYRANVVTAEQLEKAAGAASGRGESDTAGTLRQQARSYRVIASSILASAVVPSGYITGDKGESLTFDEARRQRDLERANPYVQGAATDPTNTVKDADRLHNRSLRLVAFVVGLAAVIVLLTIAQLSARRLQIPVTVIAAVAFVLLTAAAIAGDKA